MDVGLPPFGALGGGVGFTDDYEWGVCWDFEKEGNKWSPDGAMVYPPTSWKDNTHVVKDVGAAGSKGWGGGGGGGGKGWGKDSWSGGGNPMAPPPPPPGGNMWSGFMGNGPPQAMSFGMSPPAWMMQDSMMQAPPWNGPVGGCGDFGAPGGSAPVAFDDGPYMGDITAGGAPSSGGGKGGDAKGSHGKGKSPQRGGGWKEDWDNGGHGGGKSGGGNSDWSGGKAAGGSWSSTVWKPPANFKGGAGGGWKAAGGNSDWSGGKAAGGSSDWTGGWNQEEEAGGDEAWNPQISRGRGRSKGDKGGGDAADVGADEAWNSATSRGRTKGGDAGGEAGGGSASGGKGHGKSKGEGGGKDGTGSLVAAAIEKMLHEGGESSLAKTDFDARVRRVLAGIRAGGGPKHMNAALAAVRAAVGQKPRESIKNWPAYLLTLLKKFEQPPPDEETMAPGLTAGAGAAAASASKKSPKMAAVRSPKMEPAQPAVSSTSWAAVDHESRQDKKAPAAADTAAAAEEEVDDWPVRKALRKGELVEALDLVAKFPGEKISDRVSIRVLGALAKAATLGEEVMDKLMDLAGRFRTEALVTAAAEVEQKGDAKACHQLYQVAGLMAIPKTAEALTSLVRGQVADPGNARAMVEELADEDSETVLTQALAEALVAVCAALKDTELASAVFERATADGITVDMPPELK